VGVDPSEHFDHEGEFYKVKDAWSAVTPRGGHIPIYFGGASADAVRVGAEHADVYAVWGEPLAGFRERIDQIQSAAAEHDRKLRFSVSLRPIVADTEEEAWAKGREILEMTEERASQYVKSMLGGGKERGSFRTNEGSSASWRSPRRTRSTTSASGPRSPKRPAPPGNSTALVGSYEQVADSLIEYVDAGADTLLIRGFNPLDDARDYGKLVQLVRESDEAGQLVGASA
jgi:alkanesulfonate monooxygenase